jgi:NifU-like protein
MWDYSEKVKEHFFSPRNAGAVEGANAVGDVGSLSCGDALRLTLKVEPETEIILDAGFQTFGCGSAIASSSALTEMVKGLTVEQSLEISNQDIADYLDGLPAEKMHCSVMGREALQSAVANFRGEVWTDDHDEGAMICKCFAIDEVMIEDTVRANNLSTVEEVSNYTKAGGGCASCHEGIEGVLSRVLEERGETFVAAGVGALPKRKKKVAPAVEPINPATEPVPASAATSGMTNLQRIRRIETVLESIRPNLQRDGGDVNLVDVDGRNIYVHLTGACSGCQMAAMTLAGIQQQLIEDLGEYIKVIPDTEMPVQLSAEA